MCGQSLRVIFDTFPSGWRNTNMFQGSCFVMFGFTNVFGIAAVRLKVILPLKLYTNKEHVSQTAEKKNK